MCGVVGPCLNIAPEHVDVAQNHTREHVTATTLHQNTEETTAKDTNGIVKSTPVTP